MAKTNAEMMLKFVSSTSAVGVEILLAVLYLDVAKVNALNFERIFFRRFDRSSKPTTNKISRLSERQPIKSKGYLKDIQ